MAGDANFANVSLLLHGEGADGTTVVTDSSGSPSILTAATPSGTAAAISTSQKMFGASSIWFQGTSSAGGHYRFPDSAKTQFGSGDFTMEAFAYITASGEHCILSNRVGAAGWAFECDRLRAYYNGAWSDTKIVWSTPPSLNAWHHVALARSGSTLRAFLDGVQVGTDTITGAWPDSNQAFVGLGSANSNGTCENVMNGYLDEVRITKGVARYTANFTPPSASFPDGAGQISGIVTDALGTNAARTVRAYRRDTGALVASAVSDATTGAYSFYTLTADEVTILVLDNATSGTIYNDLVDRVIPA